MPHRPGQPASPPNPQQPNQPQQPTQPTTRFRPTRAPSNRPTRPAPAGGVTSRFRPTRTPTNAPTQKPSKFTTLYERYGINVRNVPRTERRTPPSPTAYNFRLNESGKFTVTPKAGGPSQEYDPGQFGQDWNIRTREDGRREAVIVTGAKPLKQPPDYAQRGQQFGLPPGGPDTVRGRFAQFVGSPVGQIAAAAPLGITGALIGSAILPGVGTLIGGIGGAALGLVAAQNNYDRNTIPGLMLHGLDLPRQAVERVAGTAYQVGGAVFEPEKYGSLQETLGNLPAAFDAAASTFESLPIYTNPYFNFDLGEIFSSGLKKRHLPFVIEDPAKMFVDYDLPSVKGGLYALTEARRRIASGENGEAVYADIATRYGAPGQLRELTSGFVADPLNFAPNIQRGILRGIARVQGNELALRAVDAAQASRGGAVNTFQAYRNLLSGEKVFREGFEVGRDLTRFQRLVLGENIIRMADRGDYAGPGKWWQVWRATPETEATERIVQSQNFLQSHIGQYLNRDASLADNAERFARMGHALKNAEPSSVPKGFGSPDEIGRVANTIEGRINRRLIDTDEMDDLATTLRAMENETATLQDVARVLDDGRPARTLGRLADEGDAISGRKSGARLALDEYKAKTGRDLTIGNRAAIEADLKAVYQIFKDGRVPYSHDHLLGAFFERQARATADFATRTYGIKPGGFLTKLTGAVKAVQGGVLLGMNPAYVVNNIINGEVTMALRGVFGIRGLAALKEEMGRAGVSPLRIGQEGIAGELGQAIGRATADVEDLRPVDLEAGAWNAYVNEAVADVIGEARKDTGTLANVRSAATRISSKSPILRLARRTERAQGVRSFYEGWRQWRSQHWRRGKGVPTMSETLENSLRQIDPRLPNLIYSAAESGLNPAEIASRIFADAPAPVVEGHVARIAASVGKSQDDVARLLAHDGIGQRINDDLAQLHETKKKPTDADYRKVFDRVRDDLEQQATERQARAYTEQLAYASEAARTGDAGEVLNLLDDVETQHFETYVSHVSNLEARWDAILRVRDPNLRDVLFKRMRDEAEQTWKRYFDYEDANYTGVVEGLQKGGMRLDENFLTAARARRERIQQFHTERYKLLDDFFAKKNQTDADWQAIVSRLDENYAGMIDDLDVVNVRVDRYMAAEFGRHYDARTGQLFDQWREGTRAFSRDDMRQVLDFRRSLRDVADPSEKNRLWRQFNTERVRRRQAIVQNSIDLRRRTFDDMNLRPDAKPPDPSRPPGLDTYQRRGTFGRPPVEERVRPTPATADELVTPESIAEVAPVAEAIPAQPELPGTPPRPPTPPATLALADAQTRIPPRTLEAMDTRLLRDTGFVGGRKHLFNAVNADRRKQGLAPYRSMVDVPLDEATAALNARLDRMREAERLQPRLPDPAEPQLRASSELAGVVQREAARRVAARELVERPAAAVPAVDVVTPQILRDEIFAPLVRGDKAQVDAGMALVEARARSLGTSADEYIASRFARVGEGERLYQVIPQEGGVRAEGTAWAVGDAVVTPRGQMAIVTKVSPESTTIRVGNQTQTLPNNLLEYGASPLFQEAALGPVWYSTLKRTIQARMPNRAAPEQIRGILKGAGVKADELRWTGFEEWLDGQSGPVSKDEALRFIDRNQIDIDEARYFENQPVWEPTIDGDGALLMVDESSTEWVIEPTVEGRYKVYEQDGPRDYDQYPVNHGEYRTIESAKDYVGEQAYFGEDALARYAKYTLPNGSNYREVLLKYAGDVEDDFISAHWGEPNVLAHYRLNDRVDADGKRVLFVEEIQSDWHQAGRTKGYGRKVPEGPFSKTWHEMTFRRILREAADEGYDRVAWTTGAQQADRYDLAKQIRSIEAIPNADGTYRLTLESLDGRQIDRPDLQSVRADDLREVVGKDLAERIVAGEGRPTPTANRQRFEGLDLKVGGEGMTGFYDKVLVDYANKYGKKWGASVGDAEIPTSVIDAAQGPGAIPTQVKVHSLDVTPAMRESVLAGQPLFQSPSGRQKGSVEFLADGRAAIRALNSPDVSTLTHELGHIFRRDLGGDDLRVASEWAGAKPHPDTPGTYVWDTAAEEKFSRGFERYLSDGYAPTPELRTVFERFKNWLATVYKRIAGSEIDVDIPPAMRRVYDRMLRETDATWPLTRDPAFMFPDEFVRAGVEYPAGALVPGVWRIADQPGTWGHGREIAQLRVLDSATLQPLEHTVVDLSRFDTTLVAAVTENAQGRMIVTDGLDVYDAALRSGEPVLAWVQPVMDSGQLGYQTGWAVTRPMTYEGALLESWARGELVDDATARAILDQVNNGQMAGLREKFPQVFGGEFNSGDLTGLRVQVRGIGFGDVIDSSAQSVKVAMADGSERVVPRAELEFVYRDFKPPAGIPEARPSVAPRPSVTGIPAQEITPTPLSRPFRRFGRERQMTFVSDVQRDLYDLAARARRKGGSSAQELAGLQADVAVRLGTTEDEALALAQRVYQDVAGQLRGASARAPAVALADNVLGGRPSAAVALDAEQVAANLGAVTPEQAAANQFLAAEIEARQGIPQGLYGDTTFARGPDPTQKYDMRHRLIEMDDLITSNDTVGNVNPAYPPQLQPRDRARIANVAQVRLMAQKLDAGAMLDDVRALDRGTPIIGPDRVVESGNGRTMAMRLAADSGLDTYAVYRSELARRAREFGIDTAEVEQMRRPVLVRERTSDVDRVEFARLGSAPPSIATSAAEEAISDARFISDSFSNNIGIGESQTTVQALKSPTNQRFVRAFIDALPENEVSKMVDENGVLSQAGVQRITAALFAKTYPGPAGLRLVRTFFDSADGGIRNIASGLTASLGDVARSESLIASGRRHSNLGIGEDLAAAVDKLATIKADGGRVDLYLAQIAVFEDELTPFQRTLLTDLDSMSRSQKRVRETLKGYARLVDESPDPNQGAMFQLDAPDKAALWERAKQLDVEGAVAPQATLFQRAEGDVVGTEAGDYIIRSVDENGMRVINPDGDVEYIPYTAEGDAPLPPGVLRDVGAQPQPHAQALEGVMTNDVRPLLESLERGMVDDLGQPQVRGAGTLDADTRTALQSWLDQVNTEMAKSKNLAVKWGEFKRDSALLNYNRRFKYNTYLGAIAPYEFWATQSMIKWALHSIDRPSVLANYYRIQKFLNTSVTEEGYPSRLAGKIRIPMPFLPDWMGDAMFIDPLRVALPFQNWIGPWENFFKNEQRVDQKAARELESLLDSGLITEDDYQQALQARSGAAWDRAVELAKEKDNNLDMDGVDLFSSFMAPSLPLNWAMNAIRGKPENIGPLPATRYVRALSAALGIGGPGGVNVEEGLRRSLGLPILDEWADYRVDRELASMAADGLITADEAREAMISRSGIAFEMAQRREAEGSAFSTLAGSLFGGAVVYPEGEKKQRDLGILYKAAWEAEMNGDSDALNRFFDEHPEYEARLALYKKPEDRMRNFLIDKVWERWMEMPGVYRTQAQQAFGDEFGSLFLDKETQDYGAIPIESLQQWAVTLGQAVPGNPETARPLPIDWAPPQVVVQVDDYYNQRETLFDWDRVSALQSEYFNIPEDKRVTLGTPRAVLGFVAARDQQFPGITATIEQYGNLYGKQKSAFRKAHPELGAFYDLRDEWKSANPQLAKMIASNGDAKSRTTSARDIFVDGNPELKAYWDWRRGYLEQFPVVQAYLDEQKRIYEEQGPDYSQYVTTFSPEVNRSVVTYLFAGRPMNAGVRKALEERWKEEGSPGGSLETWLTWMSAASTNTDSGTDYTEGARTPVEALGR